MEDSKETDSSTSRMPLNAGDTGYGSVSGPPGLSGGAGCSETAPLLVPEHEPEPGDRWQPLTKQELEVAAGGPGWRRLRCYLVLLFWLAWLAMLATSIAIIALSPRPVAPPLRWWQRSLFYQLQPELLMEAQGRGPGEVDVLCEQLPYLRSLGIGALILDDLLGKDGPLFNLTPTGKKLEMLPQIQHLITESNKAGLKVVLDVCEVDLDVAENEPSSTTNTLQFWLKQGVAGFTICDTDASYSEKTLLEWRKVLKEFSSQEEEERIVVVKQTQDVLRPLSNSSQTNETLVDVVIRSILPSSHHLLSAQEVAHAIETNLQTREDDIWPSWTVGGKASHDLKKLLLVLTMTLPGSPVVQHDEDINQIQDKKAKATAVALFAALSHTRAREEGLLYGNFTFLPFNTSTNSSSSNSSLPSPSSPPILAFLRSWGCVHFLILLNVGPEHHTLDPAWAPNLPEAGVFVTSTEMDRLGSTSLYTLKLRPHEAIVIKLFEAGSYS
ncbi:4F2 cell-surface antigen heavy chain [Echeneis naucrates]|uniref:4F2 cell-surface antigen heavy chain n=1 Tax=Echeneis naucrates TaxID=173247 RepID=UPI0011140C53|nr:4F2 cell-surface antigen heavy chain-like [Echeneis naucrates]